MPLERNESYDKVFQKILGIHVVRCPRLLKLVAGGRLSHKDFDFPIIRAAVLAAQNIVIQLGYAPDHGVSAPLMEEQYRMMIKIGGITTAEIDAICEYNIQMYSAQLEEDYYYSKVQGFLEHQRIHQAMKDLNINETNNIGPALSRAVDSAKIDFKEPIMPLVNFVDFTDVVPVPTGLLTIDEPMMGGLGKKEYGIICAHTGVGKTTFGVNIGWGAAQAGFKSCFCSLELTGQKVAQRLYSRIARYSYDKIRYPASFPDQTPEQIIAEYRARVRETAGDRAGNFHIWDFSDELCSLQKIHDWIKREQDRDPENPPSQIIIDWLLCLDENPGFDHRKMPANEVRHKLQRYGDFITKMAIQENVAIWAMHQADIKAEGKDKVTMANSAEGKSAGWKCSTFLGLGADDANRARNLFTVTASKMRDGRLFSKQIRGVLAEQRFEDYDPNLEEPAVMTIEEDLARNAANRPPLVATDGGIIS